MEIKKERCSMTGRIIYDTEFARRISFYSEIHQMCSTTVRENQTIDDEAEITRACYRKKGKGSPISCKGRRGGTGFQASFVSVAPLSLFYLCCPKRMDGSNQFILTRKANGLVGRLVAWPGFEPLASAIICDVKHKHIMSSYLS